MRGGENTLFLKILRGQLGRREKQPPVRRCASRTGCFSKNLGVGFEVTPQALTEWERGELGHEYGNGEEKVFVIVMAKKRKRRGKPCAKPTNVGNRDPRSTTVFAMRRPEIIGGEGLGSQKEEDWCADLNLVYRKGLKEKGARAKRLGEHSLPAETLFSQIFWEKRFSVILSPVHEPLRLGSKLAVMLPHQVCGSQPRTRKTGRLWHGGVVPAKV